MSVPKSKRRFYVPPENVSGNTVLIAQPEYHHIVDVIRYKEGDGICLFDGRGNEYLGSIVSVDRSNKSVKVKIEEAYPAEKPERALVLVQGLVKAAKMDFIVQKATEMGVTEIVPVVIERAVVKLDSRKEILKVAKWRRIVREAGKQCGRSQLPVLDRIWKFDEAVGALGWIEAKIICTPARLGGAGLRSISDKKPGSIAVAIGPEGGFTERELGLARSKGWVPVRAGNNIMRTETAAIAMLGILSYEFGFWD